MLHFQSKLTQYFIRNISRDLCDEVKPNCLGTDEFDYSFYLIQQGLTGIVKDQVSFVNEDAKLWFIGITFFRKGAVHFGQQAEHEG